MFPSLTLHSAMKVAVTATINAMIELRRLSLPFSTASLIDSASSLMPAYYRDSPARGTGVTT